MSQLQREIESNFDRFSANWLMSMNATETALKSNRLIYLQSYQRLVTMQAWRTFLEPRLSEESLSFFLEAQNDALTSHVFARLGSWRSALKSLRSLIENSLFCLFYKDHNIELELWHIGQHKLGFSEMLSFFEKHPRLTEKRIDKDFAGLVTLEKEYATLSKAVHGSAKGFRMTNETDSTVLWSDSVVSLRSWSTRERSVLLGLNLLLITLFRSELGGARESNLKSVLGFAVPTSKHVSIREKLGVAIS